MNHIRIGYIGCGTMAQRVHLPNFSSIAGCQVLALAELRQDLGRKVQARFGIPRLYRDHQEMLADPDIDAVALSAAFAIQGNLACDCLDAGKNVFMEKPMAISLRQADEILDAEQRSGKRVMIGYMKRYDAGNELVKSLIDGFAESGELGSVTYLRNHSFGGNWLAGIDSTIETSSEPIADVPTIGPDWLPPEYLDAYVGFLQQFTHNVNLLRFFRGADDRVAVRSVDLDDDGYTGAVIFDLAGNRAVLETGRVSHYRWDEHTQIYYQNGWIQTWAPPFLLRQVPAEVEVYRAGNAQTFSRQIASPAWSWSYKREAEHFVDAIQTGKPFRSPASDTRTDVRLFEDIYRQFLTQRGVL